MTLASFSALQLSAGALLALVVIMVLTGWLVPRRVLKDAVRDRDMWRKAYETSEQSRRLESAHTGHLLEAARVVAPIVQALPAPHSTEAGDDARTVA